MKRVATSLEAAGVLSGALGMLLGEVACAETTEWLEPVVVTATRTPERGDALPASIDRLDHHVLSDGQLGVNLSESLDRLPGVSAQSRQNYAQDLQLSVRGFGARSAFGVRGVRLYADGIPGTMPDGQGQFSQFDLPGADHIEVLRGPFSVLYGNSSGGVISIYTADAPPGSSLEGTAALGSLDTHRYVLSASGDTGAENYRLDLAHFDTEGYRDHSRAERNAANLRVKLPLSDTATAVVVANGLETPAIQDPLGLTANELALDPTAAGDNSLLYNTRKSLTQGQFGFVVEDQVDTQDRTTVAVYDGHRHTTQFQAILKSTEALATHPGGVVDLTRDFYGIDAHWTAERVVASAPLRWTLGVSADRLQEARGGFLNYQTSGSRVIYGVVGSPRQRLQNMVDDHSAYLEADWAMSSRWRLIGGVRYSDIVVNSINEVIAETPASGVRYSATTPVAGVTFRLTDALHLYGAYGQGFETPTLNDLAYRSTDGSISGLNLGLLPAHSDHFELGLKSRNAWVAFNAALFYIKTRDELAIQASSGGRSVYENIGQTERRGAELATDLRLTRDLSSHLAYTSLHAVTDTAYRACAGIPCVGTLVPAGNSLPAVPANTLYANLEWRVERLGLDTLVETLGRSRIYVDDRNSASAAGYWSTNLRFSFSQARSGWVLTETARIDNVLDRRYVGSVIVNDANGRFYEPAAGRTFDVLVSVSYR